MLLALLPHGSTLIPNSIKKRNWTMKTIASHASHASLPVKLERRVIDVAISEKTISLVILVNRSFAKHVLESLKTSVVLDSNSILRKQVVQYVLNYVVVVMPRVQLVNPNSIVTVVVKLVESRVRDVLLWKWLIVLKAVLRRRSREHIIVLLPLHVVIVVTIISDNSHLNWLLMLQRRWW